MEYCGYVKMVGIIFMISKCCGSRDLKIGRGFLNQKSAIKIANRHPDSDYPFI